MFIFLFQLLITVKFFHLAFFKSFAVFTGHFTHFYDILTYRLTFPILSLSEHCTEKKKSNNSVAFFQIVDKP